MRLAEMSQNHRGLLARDQLSVECELGHMLSEDDFVKSKRYRTLKRSAAILTSCCEYLTYQEEVARPTTVLGVHANSPAAILTALSTLIGGLALALQAVVTNYDQGYWYSNDGVYMLTNSSLEVVTGVLNMGGGQESLRRQFHG
jgi:hypothetical protein